VLFDLSNTDNRPKGFGCAKTLWVLAIFSDDKPMPVQRHWVDANITDDLLDYFLVGLGGGSKIHLNS
jgi:hypothetical protein